MSKLASGAEWHIQPLIDVGSTYDDNLGLVPGPTSSTSGYVAALRFDLDSKTELSRLRLQSALQVTDYQRSDVDDKREQRLGGDWEYHTSERGTWSATGEFRRDAIFEPLRERDGIGDVHDVDVGLSGNVRVRRKYYFLRPSWNWRLTELSSVRVSYRMTDAAFSNEVGTGLVDYSDRQLSTSYSRDLTARDSFSVTANIGRYVPDGSNDKSSTNQLLGGVTRKFSEQMEGSASFGVSRTREHAAGTTDISSGIVTSLNLRQQTDHSTLEGVISHDVMPSGIGRSLRADQVRVYWRRQLSDYMDFVVNMQLLRQRTLEGLDPNASRRYYELSPELRWHWLEDLQVVSSYRYRSQRYDTQSESANSNAVFLGLSYSL